MKTILSTLLLLLLTVSASAQTTLIKGTLRDSVSKESQPFATVRVYKKADRQKPVAMSVTDSVGRISQSVTGRGDYIISFSALGKAPVERLLSLGGQQELNLGDVLMHDDASMLGEVQVQAQRPLVKMETDKLQYDVQGDVDSKSSTVLDMLRKVPMVTVDGQDNIKVNGSSSFKVYVDGKPNPMMSSNPSQIFKAMPASMVQKIEVVTNPGAKYDAEGAVGVLNLIMNKTSNGAAQNMYGYNGNVALGIGHKQVNPSVFFSMQKGRFSLSANAMYSYRDFDDIYVSNHSTQFTSVGDSHNDVSADCTQRSNFGMGSLSMGYELDSMSSLSGQVSYMMFRNKSGNNSLTNMYGGVYGEGFDYTSRNSTKGLYDNLNVSADYQRFFNKERTKSVTLSYLFTYTPNHSDIYGYYDTDETDSVVDLTDHYSRNHTREQEHTVQLDYTAPLKALKGTFSTGLKYIYRRNSANSHYYNIDDAGTQTYVEDASSIYRYINNIAAAYAEASANVGKVGAKAGLRYEYTWQDVTYRLGRGSDFSKHYGNLVPSVSLTYNLAPTQNIGLTYNLRISRPGIFFLNPYVERTSPTEISYGNTNLDVAENHNLGLVFNSFTQKLVVNVSLRYNFCNNDISQYSFYEGQIHHSTYGNVLKQRNTSLSLFLNWSAAKNTRIMLNGSVNYNDMRSDELARHSYGWSASGMLGVQQTLPWQLKLSANLMGNSKFYSLQGWNGGFSGFFGSLSRDFLKDKLNVALQGFTPFGPNGHFRMKSRTYADDFDYRTLNDVKIPHLTLKITYNFGNMKRQVRQYQSKIKNDFMEGGNSQQQTPVSGQGM